MNPLATLPLLIATAPAATPSIEVLPRAIYQRNGSNKATIPIIGTSRAPYTSIQGRAISIRGGTTTKWTTLHTYSGLTTGDFSTTFPNITAGWYQMQIRTTYFGNPNGVIGVPFFGVGDNLITCGQSLYANSNQTPTAVDDDRINAYGFASPETGWITATNWIKANDQQPVTGGSGGSIWPLFANSLIDWIDVPIGLLSLAVGGTSVAQWDPTGAGTSPNWYYLLQRAVQFFGPNNVKAILWGQGERDTELLTSQASYEASMANVIDSSRADLGSSVPWVINREGWIGGSPGYPPVLAAQVAMQSYTNCFAGANFETMNNAFRIDGVHLNLAGQTQGALLLYNAVKAAFY